MKAAVAEDVIITDVVPAVAVEASDQEEIAEAEAAVLVVVEDLDLIEDHLHLQAEMVALAEHLVVKVASHLIVIVHLADLSHLEELQKVHQIERQEDQMIHHLTVQEDQEKANTAMC